MRSEWMGLLVVAVLLVLVTPYLAFHGAIFGHEHGVHLAVVTTPVHHLPQVRRARALSSRRGSRATRRRLPVRLRTALQVDALARRAGDREAPRARAAA